MPKQSPLGPRCLDPTFHPIRGHAPYRLVCRAEMMTNVHTWPRPPANQNEPEQLMLLGAQRAAYRNAKALRAFRLAGSVLPAALAPVFLLAIPDSAEALAGLVSLFAVAAVLLLRTWERRLTKTGALLQEQFDCQVLPLPWNETLLGPPIPTEHAHRLGSHIDSAKEKLGDWYPVFETDDPVLRCLAMQRTNMVWTHDLRREYSWVLAAAGLILLGLYWGMGLALDVGFRTYVVAFLVPTIPALVHAVDMFTRHRDAANDGESTRMLAEGLFSGFRDSSDAVTLTDCRLLQDRIAISRRNAPSVPDWWYWFRRSAFEQSMRYGARLAHLDPPESNR